MSEKVKHKTVPKQNLGVKFEQVIKECFRKVEDTTLDRIKVAGYQGETNPADFIVFNSPFQFYFECKAVRGNTLSFWRKGDGDRKVNVTQGQVEGLTDKQTVTGVIAGVIVWFIDHDTTLFIDIRTLNEIGKDNKSFNVTKHKDKVMEIPATKKRLYFDYDMTTFLDMLEMKELSVDPDIDYMDSELGDDFVDDPYLYSTNLGNDFEFVDNYVKGLVGVVDDELY